MNELLAVARSRGLRKMTGLVLGSNFKMLAFCRKLGFDVHISKDDNSMRVVEQTL